MKSTAVAASSQHPRKHNPKVKTGCRTCKYDRNLVITREETCQHMSENVALSVTRSALIASSKQASFLVRRPKTTMFIPIDVQAPVANAMGTAS